MMMSRINRRIGVLKHGHGSCSHDWRVDATLHWGLLLLILIRCCVDTMRAPPTSRRCITDCLTVKKVVLRI